MSALGRLVASVILDHAEFVGGTEKAKQAAASMAGDIDRSLKQLEGSVKTSLGAIAAGLAAGFGVAAMKEAFDQYTKNAAALQDLALKAGTTVQWLSSIGPVAKLSGTSLDDVTMAAEKLSKGLVNGLTKESASASQALAFLGVNARDNTGKLKDSGTLIEEIAGKLDTYQDGIAKTTIAQDLFGKSGANLLPFLKELAEYGERDAKVTEQQSALAKQYEQDLVRLKIAKQALFNTISRELLPVSDAFVQALLGMSKGTGGVKAAVDDLASSGAIRDFAMSGVRAFGLLLNAGDSVARIFDAVGEALGGLAARLTNTLGAALDSVIHFIRGDYAKAWDDLKQGAVRDSAIIADTGARIRGVFEKPLAGDAFVATVEEKLKGIDSALNKNAESSRKAADGYKSVADAAAAQRDAVDGLIKTLDVHVAKLQTELDYMSRWGITTKETTVATTLAQIKVLEETGVLEKAAKARGASTDALKEEILQRAAQVDGLIAATAGALAYVEAVKKLNDAAAESVQKLVDQVRAERDKIATLGMSQEKITRYTIAELERKKALALTTEGTAEYVKQLQLQIDKLSELADAQGKYLNLDQQAKQWGELADRAGRFFGDLVVNGKSAFDRLRQELKNFVQDLIALMAKKWILNMAAGLGVSGAAGAAEQAGANTLAGAGASAVGSWVGGAGTAIGGAYGASEGFAMGWASGVAGPTAGYAEVAGATLSGIYDGVAAVLADIPVYGWIALAVLAIAAYFGGRGGGPKTGGSALGAFDAQGNLLSDQTGTLNRRTQLHDETQQDTQAMQVGSAIARSWAQTAARLGGTATGMQFGIGWNSDPRGDAPSQVSSMVRDASGREIFSQSNLNVGRSDKELSAEIQLQGERAVLAALKSSGLPAYLAKVFDGVDAMTATHDQIVNIINTALALKDLYDVASRNPLEDVATAIANSQNQFQHALKSNNDQILAIAKAYDGSLASTQNLTAATKQYYNAQLQLLLGITQVSQAIDSMFASTFRNIELAGLDKQGKYNYYQHDAEAAQQEALRSNDPARIQQLAQRINEDINAAFSLLSPEEQAAQSGAFLERGRAAQKELDARLEKLQKDAATKVQETLDKIKELIGAGSEAQTAAANTQVTAANRQLDAANTPLQVVLTDVNGQQVTGIR